MVQKSYLHIVLGAQYHSYESALKTANLESLEERRTQLCLKFAIKASKHPKHQNWFVGNTPSGADTRNEKVHFRPPLCRLKRYVKSPIPYLTNLLNSRKWTSELGHLTVNQWTMVTEDIETDTLPCFVCDYELCYSSLWYK